MTLPKGVRLVEGRQWLFVCLPERTLVADDHSTNQSIILPQGVPAATAEPEPRYGDGVFSYSIIHGKRKTGRVDLDWEGNVVYSLNEGDVLLTIHAAFVFGRDPS